MLIVSPYYPRQGGYVIISVSLFVCLLIAGLCKICRIDFHKIWWKVVHGSRKKPLDYDVNPDHIILWLGSEFTLWTRLADQVGIAIVHVLLLTCHLSRLSGIP